MKLKSFNFAFWAKVYSEIYSYRVKIDDSSSVLIIVDSCCYDG
ncbi:hypothetical protein MNB_SV-6-1401 [hydrothermal vent metagenome]|uniref:Uncharacterized protein n=1 Tax=hydrothermal vent metagenome TaxID=652676 RepID=A0A1W1B9K7_9ZZZZ